MHLRASWLVAPAAAVILLSCGGGDDTSRSDASATPAGAASSSSPAIGKAGQDLDLSGPVVGKMSSAETTCSVFKANSPTDKDRFQVVLVGDVAGASHRIRLIFYGYTGPGDYKAPTDPTQPAVVQVELDQGGGRGSGKINSDGKSGSVDADILSPSAGKISGAWSCPSAPK